MIASSWRNRSLIAALVKREVVGRYRGSVMGIAWSFFTPLLMLVIYTFVFSIVFQARWGLDSNESKTDFALILFVGLIVHGLFAECINRAPLLIITNVNYVKKSYFPIRNSFSCGLWIGTFPHGYQSRGHAACATYPKPTHAAHGGVFPYCSATAGVCDFRVCMVPRSTRCVRA
jgi:hypothetical protein